jgi:hypothetical protein
MKITCTVEEFANMVLGCHDVMESKNCSKCALYCICSEYDGNITQFVTADTIIEEDDHAAD